MDAQTHIQPVRAHVHVNNVPEHVQQARKENNSKHNYIIAIT